MDQAGFREPDDPFVYISFDGETRLLRRARCGRGRQGKLTQESLTRLNAVKQAGGQCERCWVLKKACDRNTPCNQCKGANSRPGSRWFGRPCVRRKAQLYLERPLGDNFSSRGTEETSPYLDNQNFPSQSMALSLRSPSLPVSRALSSLQTQDCFHSNPKDGHSASLFKSSSESIRNVRYPLFNGTISSWVDARSFIQVESAHRKSTAQNHWIFTIYIENLSRILQSMLPPIALGELFEGPTNTISSSQDHNSAYIRLFVFLAANNFPSLNFEAVKALLQPLQRMSRKQLDTFFCSIASPTQKALAENIFCYAIMIGHERTIESMLQSQSLCINVNNKILRKDTPDSGLISPLELCYQMGQPAVAKILIRYKARVNGDRWSDILGLAVPKSSRSLVETELLSQLFNANAFAKSADLDCILAHHGLNDVRTAIRDLSYKDYHSWHWKALLLCFILAEDYEACSKIVNLMIANQVDLNWCPNGHIYKFESENVSVIDIVVWKGYLDLACLLLRSGARLTLRTLFLATQSGNEACIDLWLRDGAEHLASFFIRIAERKTFAAANYTNNRDLIRLLVCHATLYHLPGRRGRDEIDWLKLLIPQCNADLIDELFSRLDRDEYEHWQQIYVRAVSSMEEHFNSNPDFSNEMLWHMPRQSYEHLSREGFFHRFIWIANYAICSRLVDLLIDAHINLDHVSSIETLGKVTIVDLVSRKGYLILAQALLRAGACLTDRVLLNAVQSQCMELVQFLLEEGAKDLCMASVKKKSFADGLDGSEFDDSSTLFAEAIRTNQLPLIRLLLQYGAFSHIKKQSELREAMIAASSSGNVEIAQTLLAIAKPKVTKYDPYYDSEPPRFDYDRPPERSWYPDAGLDLAIVTGQTEIVLLFVRNNFVIKASHLTLAIYHRRIGVIRALVDADIATFTANDSDILSDVVKWGERSLIQELISRGFEVVSPYTLSAAVRTKDTKLLELLLDAGAYFGKPHTDRHGKMVASELDYGLARAAELGDIKMVRMLLQYGVNSWDSSALHKAVSLMDYELVYVLLEAFSRQYTIGKKGYGTSAFMVALKMDDPFWMNYLIDKLDITGLCEVNLDDSGNVHITDSRRWIRSFDMSPLGFAIVQSEDLECKETWIHKAKILLEHGVDPQEPVIVQGNRRETALLYAIGRKNVPIVKLLLEHKADLNYPAAKSHGRTPLQLAAELGSYEIVQVLLNNGAVVNDRPAQLGGATALQFAAIKCYIGILVLLLEHGADVNAPPADSEGRTALEGAAEWGRLDVVKILLDAGVDVESDNGIRYLRSAIAYARKNGHNAVSGLLEAYDVSLWPCPRPIYTDREGWTFWAVETDEGFEAWEGEIPPSIGSMAVTKRGSKRITGRDAIFLGEQGSRQGSEERGSLWRWTPSGYL